MSWDAYEILAALMHAPMLLPVALAPALLWVQWAWPRRPKRGLALQGLAISAGWSLLLAYLWRPGWGPQAAWGYWQPVLISSVGRLGLVLGGVALFGCAKAYRGAPSRRVHLQLQMVWGCLWYLAFVLGGR